MAKPALFYLLSSLQTHIPASLQALCSVEVEATCLSGMVDWSGRTRCRGKGLSYQVEPPSALQRPLSFQASSILTESFKELFKSASYLLSLRWRESCTRTNTHKSLSWVQMYSDVLKWGRCSWASVGVRWREVRLEVLQHEEVEN